MGTSLLIRKNVKRICFYKKNGSFSCKNGFCSRKYEKEKSKNTKKRNGTFRIKTDLKFVKTIFIFFQMAPMGLCTIPLKTDGK